MRVVRQRMIKPFKQFISFPMGALALLPLMALLSSCNPTEITGSNVKSGVAAYDGSFENKAYIYKDSPYIIAGPKYGPANVDMGELLDPTPQLITTNSKLTGNCAMLFMGMEVELDSCIHSLEKESATNQPLPRKADKTYIFSPGSPEFYQTNTLYHLSLGTKTFFDKLSTAYEMIHSLPYTVPKSIPFYLSDTNLFWFKALTSQDRNYYKYDFLTSYAQCEYNQNANFQTVGPTLCFGYHSDYPGFQFVQDPSVIQHELGHALINIMMNMRNGTDASTYHPFRSNLFSNMGYNEPGAINEGIADYYSYIMNKRERFAEFALGRTGDQARPISEADSLHISAVAETSEGRLSYPQYLLYDPNEPEVPYEDVHYAGQITSHYLVALTKSLKTSCGLNQEADGGHETATSYVLLLLAETLSEIGDLNARGLDYYHSPITGGSDYFNNLDETNSYLWTHYTNSMNYRRFFQVFSKNIYKYISGNLCTSFDKNKSEKLLDDYGLLLFKTYNDNGNSTKDRSVVYRDVVPFIANQPLTAVSESNRRKSVLVSKQLIELAEKTDLKPDLVSFYLVDNKTDIDAFLGNLIFKGFSVPLSTGSASTDYNNNNIKISPGEVIGVIPNLYNKSNSVIAGAQILANDWDHVDVTDQSTGNFKPCVFDDKTTADQGGEAARTCSTTETSYNRLIKDAQTGLFPTSAVAPVCFVQLEEGESSRWVSQNEFRKKQGLSLLDKDCLGYSTSTETDEDFTYNPHECLVRFLPGANSSSYSRIEPQKSYYDSRVKESGGFDGGNMLLLEVNKWIPPGTKFRCRLRARFSNCSDCYADAANSNDDYIDADYNGQKPFQIINFDFYVND